jgi:hypothetical protein
MPSIDRALSRTDANPHEIEVFWGREDTVEREDTTTEKTTAIIRPT